MFRRIGDERARSDRDDRALRDTRDLYFDTVTFLDYGIHTFDHYFVPHAVGGFYPRYQSALKKELHSAYESRAGM